MQNSDDVFSKLLDFLDTLDGLSLHYSLARFRADSIAVVAVVPGERWEIEFMREGGIEVEVFRSDGTIEDESGLRRLLTDNAM